LNKPMLSRDYLPLQRKAIEGT